MNNEGRLDDIIPKIIEKMEKKMYENLTPSEYIKKIVATQTEIKKLDKEWALLSQKANKIEKETKILSKQLIDLLSHAKDIVGDFTPEEIIGEGD